jgi:hypothetical protein
MTTMRLSLTVAAILGLAVGCSGGDDKKDKAEVDGSGGTESGGPDDDGGGGADGQDVADAGGDEADAGGPEDKRKWSEPAAISVESAALPVGDGGALHIAVASTRAAVVGWSESSAGSDKVWVATRGSDAKWQTATAASDAITHTLGIDPELDVAVSGGKGLVVWTEGTDADTTVKARRMDGATWAAAETLSGTTGRRRTPAALVEGSGDGLVIWSKTDDTSGVIEGTRFTSAAWSAAAALGSVAKYCSAPGLVQLGGGKALAAWEQDDDAADGQMMAAGFADGSWDAPSAIGKAGEKATSAPSLATDGAGAAVAVWTQASSSQATIWSNSLSASGSWSDAALIADQASTQSTAPRVAAAPEIGALTVWIKDDVPAGVVSKTWSTGAADLKAWSPAKSVQPATPTTVQSFAPVIAADASKSAVAAWRQDDGIYAARFTGGQWREPEALVKGAVGFPAIAMDGAGRALVVWTQTISGKTRVYVSELSE